MPGDIIEQRTTYANADAARLRVISCRRLASGAYSVTYVRSATGRPQTIEVSAALVHGEPHPVLRHWLNALRGGHHGNHNNQ